jgi:hypothetical protein
MTESTHQVIVSDKPNLAAARVISGGLSRYNREMAGYNDARKLSVLVCENGSDKVIGGLLGRTSLGMFFVDLFFLPKSHRGRGVGTRICRSRGEETRVFYCRALHDHISGPGFL